MAKEPRNYSPYQQKIIKRYYENSDSLGYQRLAELAGEIYLAEGKKLDRLWKQVEKGLDMVKISPERAAHLLSKRDPKLLADLVKELTDRGGK